MQVDPAALSNPLGTTSLSALSTKTIPAPLKIPKSTSGTGLGTGSLSQSSQQSQRIDYEPIYAELKALVGPERWMIYKEAFGLFMKGQLNQNEFNSRVDSILSSNAKIQHLHNRFICAMIANLTKDLPDPGVASWVSANDKPTLSAKQIAGNMAQQRLKTEVMHLPPRDRRRLKGLVDTNHGSIDGIEAYQMAKQITAPEHNPGSAGGLNKTNWELEIRKRYAQPLASEIGEFPDADAIQARMIPICYEESVPAGASAACSGFMSIATEIFIKEFLSDVFMQTRSNAPTSMGVLGSVMTKSYQTQLNQETMGLARGEISRNHTNGMLPVEAREALGRSPIGTQDLRLAVQVCGKGILGHYPITCAEIVGGWRDTEVWEMDDLEELEETIAAAAEIHPEVNGVDSMSNMMDVDDADIVSPWEGGTKSDRDQLGSILDECLNIGSTD